MQSLFFSALLLSAPTAWACPGKGSTADAEHDEAGVVADATKCTKKTELVGDSCSYSTGMMAQRVHADGADLTLTSAVQRSTTKLDSQVAAPFVVDGYHVIANEVIEALDPNNVRTLQGKALEVDGVRYFLVTSFKANS